MGARKGMNRIKDKKATNFLDIIDKFNTRFKEIDFILSEETVCKIKNSIIGSVINFTIEDLCLSLKNINKDIQVDIFPIKVYIKNNDN